MFPLPGVRNPIPWWTWPCALTTSRPEPFRNTKFAGREKGLAKTFLLIKPEVGHMGLLEFALLLEAVEAGRTASQTVISELKNR